MTLRILNYGNYGIFLIMGSAGFCPSAVRPFVLSACSESLGDEISQGSHRNLEDGVTDALSGWLDFEGYKMSRGTLDLNQPKPSQTPLCCLLGLGFKKMEGPYRQNLTLVQGPLIHSDLP